MSARAGPIRTLFDLGPRAHARTSSLTGQSIIGRAVNDTPGDAADGPAALRIASALDAIGKAEYPN